MTNMVFRERILINSMFSMAPNIVLAPNMTQNAGRRTQTQLISGHSVHGLSLRRVLVLSPVGKLSKLTNCLYYCK